MVKDRAGALLDKGPELQPGRPRRGRFGLEAFTIRFSPRTGSMRNIAGSRLGRSSPMRAIAAPLLISVCLGPLPALGAGACQPNPSANCAGADLRGFDGVGQDFSGADFHDANLSASELQGAKLPSVNLLRANLYAANLKQADLSGATLKGATLRQAHLDGADLRGADLRAADFSFSVLEGADLRGADLRGARLQMVDLRKVRLDGAQIEGALWPTGGVCKAGSSGSHCIEGEPFSDEPPNGK
ncbi:pentapeptide repeat-containing protein [Rhodoblastus sp.]|uniref:pentapeptide repeat-containing protein n=1 Tax=Rhodoblastus sp. TaxID=1962975 RepID=UPI0031454470